VSTVDLTLTITDDRRGFRRSERLYRTAGRFAIHDLPAGHFAIVAAADGGKNTVDVDLADGEDRTGLVIDLEALITLTGRVVDAQTKQPVPGIRMLAELTRDVGGYSLPNYEPETVSNATGAFTIHNVQRGEVVLMGWPEDRTSSYQTMSVRTITADAPSPFDFGDLPAFKARIRRHEPVGTLGIRFANPATEGELFRREYKVSSIDPEGPAAKTDLKVGDVVTSIDGYDITGANANNAMVLMRAPPGTKLALGLARGLTVTVTLAAP
jgi:hypothetical protein